MEVDRSALGAQTYALPTVEAQPLQAPQQPWDDGVKALEGLQYVKGQTEDYYKKVAALKSFMQDAHSNYGLDVRVPDLSRPESIRLHQIYNDAISDILQHGNSLKQGQMMQTLNTQMRNQYAPGVDPTQQSVAEMRSGVDFYPEAAQPTVTQTNDLTQQPSFDKENYDAKMKAYEEKVAYYDNLTKEHPETKANNEYQKSILTKPAQAVKQWAPQRTSYQERNAGRKVQAAGNFVDDIVNLQAGTSDSYKLDTKVLNPTTGNPLYVSNDHQDATRGTDEGGKPKAIKYWGHDPETDQTFIFFKDGSYQDVSPNKENPLNITRGILADNSARYGIDAEYVDEWADKNGQFQKGVYNPSSQLRSDAAEIKKSRRTEQSKSVSKVQQEGLKQELQGFNENETSPWIGSNPKRVYESRDGRPIGVKRAVGGGLYLTNPETLIPVPSRKDRIPAYKRLLKQVGPDGEGLTPAEMSAFLIKLGAHEKFAQKNKPNTGTKVAPVKESKTTQADPDI